jgi:hypothetical protein
MQMHAPEVAHDNHSSSHGSPAHHAGAPAGTHLPNPELSPDENEVPLFDSCDHARAERDRLFRKPLAIAGDDVEEVDQHDGRYVLAIVKALRHKDFLPPPETKKTRAKNADGTKAKKTAAELIVNLSDSDKAKWLKWQQDGQAKVEAHLDQPKRKADTLFHYQAWEVVSEVIKIHRQGFLFTNKKTDEELKCSARIEEAVRVIKGYALVRSKLLNGDKISNFCISPQAYAKVTVEAFWNNSGRKKNTDAVPSKRVANRNGALAGRYGEDKKSKNRRKPAETKGSGLVETGDGVEQEPSTAVSSENTANESSPAGTDGEGDDEDADWEDDDDANNAFPTFNNGGLGDNRFGYVPDRLSQRESPQDDNIYEANLSNNMNPTTMSPFYRPIQVRPYESGTSDLGARTHTMPVPSALMSPATGFNPSTTTRKSYPEPSMYSYSPRGLSTEPGPAMDYLRNPTQYITENTIPRQPSAGPPNTQGPQSDISETRPNKRRKPAN